MSLYDLPEFKLPAKNPLPKNLKKIKLSGKKIIKRSFQKNSCSRLIILNIFLPILFGFCAGAIGTGYFFLETRGCLNDPIPKEIENRIPQISQEEAVIKVAEEVSSSVVSIVISKDVAVEKYYDLFNDSKKAVEMEKREIGSGSGFIISQDGMVLTNKHVVSDEGADYAIFTNEGREFSAEVLARDPFKDLAVLKIISDKTDFKPMKLGDSDDLRPGQSVIAIGNALGEFSNTISVGIVSGLGRSVTASGGGITENLENLIQTDAAINRGNSGGPLLNLQGEVIGVNVAMSQSAQNIGFSIPINDAKKDIEMVKEKGEIVYPFLGVRYVIITSVIQEEEGLLVDYGALIVAGDDTGELAVTPGSAAEDAGLEEGDIILEFNNEKITSDNSLAKIIQKYDPGDEIVLKILRNKNEETVTAVLGQRDF